MRSGINHIISNTMQKTRKQHYVPQFYLKYWEDVNKSIWIIRNGKIFSANKRNICEERDFYLPKELNDDEKKVINVFLDKLNGDMLKNAKYQIDVIQEMIILNRTCNDILNSLSKLFNNEEIIEIKNKFEIKSSILVDNLIEEWYGFYEEEIGPIINKLNEKSNSNISKEEYQKIILFMSVQLFRTKRTRDFCVSIGDSLKKEGKFINVDWSNIALYLPFICSFVLATNLCNADTELKIVNNKTNRTFITSDNPVVNLCADYSSEVMPKNVIMFYPISPYKAVILSDKENENNKDINDESMIDKINKKIIEASNSIIISSNEETAKFYLKLVSSIQISCINFIFNII